MAVHAEHSATETDQNLEHLLDVTESVADYAQEVLPRALSNRRNAKSQNTYTSSRLDPRDGSRVARPSSLYSSSSSISTDTTPSINSSRYTSDDSGPVTDVSSNTESSKDFTQSKSPVLAHRSQVTDNAEMQDNKRHHTTEDVQIHASSITNSAKHNKKIIKPKTWRIGRHTICLGANFLRINGNDLRPHDYENANKFVASLFHHQDKLDKLDEALSDSNRNDEWTGIPGWRISFGQEN